MALACGSKLGRYEIESPLGAGGMGEVYRARDTQLGRHVALKALPESVLCDEISIERFQREARSASSLNHPHICTVYDVGEQDGTHYIAMELMEGSTLGHMLASGPLPMEDVLKLGIQIADGLAATNQKGLIHRDIKPSNIFVTSRYEAKLLDFGLAKEYSPAKAAADAATLAGAMTLRGEVLGTVGYMSPEQAEGKPLDARSDIFSFGAVLYEMATGRRAFSGSSNASIIAEILRSEPAPAASLNPKVPGELQRIISKALEKQPPDRYQSAHELMIDLRRLKRQTFDSSGTVSATYGVVPVRWWRREIAFLVGLTGLVVLILVAVSGLSPAHVTRILDSQQITYSTERKDPPLVTDGARLYFQGQDGPVEMSVKGGSMAPLHGSTAGMHMLDVSVDGSQLLALKQNLGDEQIKGSIWSIPVLGGSPKRIGNEMVTDARWLPDGRSVIYMYLRSVFITGPDGANAKLVWQAPGDASDPSLSPDGRHIRLTVEEGNNHLEIWQINIDGSHAHRLLADWPSDSNQAGGRWTPDGRHFIFQSDVGGTDNIYELIEPGWLEFWKKPTAAKLTSGEVEVLDAIPSRDNRQLFVMGRLSQGAMQVFDPQQKHFVPFLGGLAASEFVISPDKQWMAYTDFPRHFLWRSRLDGSEKLQLTSSYAVWPRWSPDGKNIAYMDWQSIYLISSEGGTPEKLIGGEVSAVAPEWTPDGKSITFNDYPRVGTKLKGVKVLDLASRRVSIFPGSEGFYVGSWSPDGNYLVAVAQNPLRMMLYNVQTHSWSELRKFDVPWGYWVWTPDSKALLFAQIGKENFSTQTEQKGGIYRLTIADGKWERIARLDGIHVEDQANESFLNLTADGRPAIMNDTSVVQIYSLPWK